ncbi:hypothetical protein FIU82_07540 [Pseudoalteromonas sp. THAF3]|uniref:hypothetical protein n=1 Tax=Pseudoalteromonas sp. THAF3 TaxID=2587843 RepID=UPI00126968E8|nr:hypothetical protein [Pseudoalteromonas sp. THAF3]QFU04865.1 hypothetical protein FIU82_07540 [Pseudoalteromonas sp. THAF3]
MKTISIQECPHTGYSLELKDSATCTRHLIYFNELSFSGDTLVDGTKYVFTHVKSPFYDCSLIGASIELNVREYGTLKKQAKALGLERITEPA